MVNKGKYRLSRINLQRKSGCQQRGCRGGDSFPLRSSPAGSAPSGWGKMHRNLSIKVIRTCDWGRAYCTVRADLQCIGCAFGTGPGPPGAGEGASRPRPRLQVRPAGAQAQCAEAGARLLPTPRPTARRGPRAGQTPASASSWGRSVGLRVPAGKFVRPPQQNKNVWIPYVDRASSSRRRRHFQKFPVASRWWPLRKARRRLRYSLALSPAFWGRSRRRGDGDAGSARSAADPIAPRPLGTPRPRPRLGKLLPAPLEPRPRAGRADGRGGGPGGGALTLPVPCPRHVPAPRPPRRAAPSWERAGCGEDGGDRRCFEPGLGSVRGGYGAAESTTATAEPRPSSRGRPSRAGRAWGLCGRGGVATGEEEGGARFRAPAPGAREEPSVAPASSPPQSEVRTRPAPPRWQDGPPAGSAGAGRGGSGRAGPGGGGRAAAAPLPEHGAAARVRAGGRGAGAAGGAAGAGRGGRSGGAPSLSRRDRRRPRAARVSGAGARGPAGRRALGARSEGNPPWRILEDPKALNKRLYKEVTGAQLTAVLIITVRNSLGREVDYSLLNPLKP